MIFCALAAIFVLMDIYLDFLFVDDLPSSVGVSLDTKVVRIMPFWRFHLGYIAGSAASNVVSRYKSS